MRISIYNLLLLGAIICALVSSIGAMAQTSSGSKTQSYNPDWRFEKGRALSQQEVEKLLKKHPDKASKINEHLNNLWSRDYNKAIEAVVYFEELKAKTIVTAALELHRFDGVKQQAVKSLEKLEQKACIPLLLETLKKTPAAPVGGAASIRTRNDLQLEIIHALERQTTLLFGELALDRLDRIDESERMRVIKLVEKWLSDQQKNPTK